MADKLHATHTTHSQSKLKTKLKAKSTKGVKLKDVKLMTQRAEGNLIGALKKESNLTIKQALNTVVITVILTTLVENGFFA